MFRITFLATLVLTLFSGVGFAEEPGTYKAESLADYSQAIDVVNDLEARGSISPEEAEKQREYYTGQAEVLAGRELTTENSDTWFALDGWTILVGFGWLLGSIALVIACGLLFGSYIVALIAAIPVVLWEFIFYGAAIGCLFLSGSTWVIVLGACLFLGALWFTLAMHFDEKKEFPLWQTSLVCAVVWGFAAFFHQSEVLGFMSVMAVESFLGFSILVGPLCVFMGFRNDDNIATATFGSLLLLTVGVIFASPEVFSVATGPLSTYLAPYQFGMLAVGTFVYFIGMLILGSYWYRGRKGSLRYALMQIVMIASGCGALYLGTTLGLGWLYGVGGVFFVLWLCEKYVEVCVETKVGWQWALFFGAIILLSLSYFMNQNPELLLWTQF